MLKQDALALRAEVRQRGECMEDVKGEVDESFRVQSREACLMAVGATFDMTPVDGLIRRGQEGNDDDFMNRVALVTLSSVRFVLLRGNWRIVELSIRYHDAPLDY